jgi:hypothetical protein
MLRRRSMKRAVGAVLLLLLLEGQVRAGNAPIGGGGSCSGQTITDPVASTQGQQQAFDDGLYTCTGTSWVPEALIVGGVLQDNSSPSCNSTNAGMIEWTGSILEYCNGTSWTSVNAVSYFATYDLAIFYPGTIGASAFVRIVAARAATYATNLAGSYCVAKEGATSSTTVNINQIHAGTSTNRGTVVFGSGGGTNVTNCTFTAASGISLAAGDAVEFAFPASPDATLGDVAITLQGTHQ